MHANAFHPLPPIDAPDPAADAAERAANDTHAPDPLTNRAEERLAILREVTDLVMAYTRAAVRHGIQALEAEANPADAHDKTDAAAAPPAAPRRDPAETLAKLTRIVRLTLTLEAKLEDALAARLAGEVAKAETRRAAAEKEREAVDNDPFSPLKSGAKARVRQLVREAADREIGDPEDHDILIHALEERLLCDEAYDDIEGLPLRDIVEHLCADLMLKPDWRRWAGDGWAPNPPFTRPRCSDFTAPSRVPILQDTGDPDPRE